MKKYYGVIILLFILVKYSHGQPGNLFIRNFSPGDYHSDEYTSGPENYDIIMDNRGILFICNSNNILEYDGIKWKAVKDAFDLESNYRSLSKNEHGRIYLGGGSNLGFLMPDSAGRMCFQALKKDLETEDFKISETYCLKNAVYFIADSLIFLYNGDAFDIIKVNGTIRNSFEVNKRIYILVDGKGLFEIVDRQLIFVEGTQLFTTLKPVAILAGFTRDDSSAWMIVTKDKLLRWSRGILSPMNVNYALKRVHCAALLNDGIIALGTEVDGLILVSPSGKVLKVLNKSNGLNDNSINKIYADGRNGLWLCLSNGISRIDFPAPVSSFSESDGMSGVANCIQKYDGKLYVGTSSGLYVLSERNYNSYFSVDSSFEFVWGLSSFNNQLAIAAENGAFLQNGGTRKRIYNERTYSICCFSDLLFLGTVHGVVVFRREKDDWKFAGNILHGNEIRTLLQNRDGDLIASSAYKIFRIRLQDQFVSNPSIDTIPIVGENNKDNYYYPFLYNHNMYLGSGYNGFFRYDNSPHHFISDSTLNNVLGKYHEAATPFVDFENNLWFVADTRIGRIYQQQGKYVWDTIPFMRVPKSDVYSFFRDSNMLWIGTNEGFYSFDFSVLKNYDLPFHTLLRSVKMNGENIFEGAFLDTAGNTSLIQNNIFKKQIPYKGNSISFEFAAATYDSKEKTLYNYYLEGLDPPSTTWSADVKKEYSHLHKGNYVFHVKAKNIYGSESDEATFAFAVLAPWYRTWWAYLIYAAIAYVIIVAIVRINLWRLHQTKRNLEATIRERTSEVRHQKEVIEDEKLKVEQKSLELEKTLNDLKQAQSQLVQSEKMASLGQLTAGIAHELNNPINFVSANVTPLKNDVGELLDLVRKYDAAIDEKRDDDSFKSFHLLRKHADAQLLIEEISKLMSGIEEGAKRTAEIVKGLRSFSRTDESEMKLAQVNDLIDSTFIILHNKMKDRVEVVKNYGNLPQVECYPGQLNQVFLNVLNNAIQAIQGVGKIFITTCYQDNHVIISIRDTGTGIAEEARQHIFDPFFTTKPVGEGTGLGLSISYGIIEKHHGKITVKSEAGNGTEFIISLPA